MSSSNTVCCNTSCVESSGPVGSGCPCKISILSTTINALNAEVRNQQESRISLGGSSYPTTTADIVSLSKLDYEQADPMKLQLSGGSVVWTVTVEGQSLAKTDQTSTTLVKVTILDLNDNSPVFVPSKAAMSVPENMAVGSTVIAISVADQDSSANGQFDVKFKDNVAEQTFSIFYISDGIAVKNKKLLDREQKSFYSFVLVAVDRGSPSLTGEASVNITVLDVNDNTPKFTQSSLSLVTQENTPVGTTLSSLSATDPDLGVNGAVQFSVIGGTTNGLVELTADGIIRVAKPIDYESLSQYMYYLIIEARDNGNPARSSNISVSITVTNENEHNPQFNHSDMVWTIPEDAPTGYKVGQVHATDQDSVDQSRLVYFIKKPGSKPFHIDNQTGEIYTTQDTFDYEVGHRLYTLDVYVTDGGSPVSLEDNIQVNVTITDSNEFAPVFQQSWYRATVYLLTDRPGSIIGRVQATDGDAGSFGIIRYSLNSPLFFLQLTADSGEILWSNQTVNTGMWNVTIKATDIGGRKDTAVLTITVTDAAPPTATVQTAPTTQKETTTGTTTRKAPSTATTPMTRSSS